ELMVVPRPCGCRKARPHHRQAEPERARTPSRLKTKEICLKHTSEEAQSRAEASFKKKERQAIEGAKAMAEYQAQMLAVRDRTARLRALRLAREAEQAQRA